MRFEVDRSAAYAYTGTRVFDAALATVVFVHGAAHDHSVWALQSRYFAYHRRNVLAVDLPGHGRSDGPVRASVGDIAAWIIALLDALRIDRAALVGHSLGSLAALRVAAANPARVSALAMLGPAVPMPVSDVLLDAARADVEQAYALITGWSFAYACRLGGNPQPGIWMTGNARRLMQRSGDGVLLADLLACHRYADGLDDAAKIRCPTLLMLGERDLMAPPRNTRPLIETLANARVVTLRDCGHSMMVEAPDAVLDGLRDFL